VHFIKFPFGKTLIPKFRRNREAENKPEDHPTDEFEHLSINFCPLVGDGKISCKELDDTDAVIEATKLIFCESVDKIELTTRYQENIPTSDTQSAIDALKAGITNPDRRRLDSNCLARGDCGNIGIIVSPPRLGTIHTDPNWGLNQ
jgi:hypothetical protein